MRNLDIHKALACEDVIISIKLSQLPTPRIAKRIFEAEGKSIANILWDSLPGPTVDAIKSELERLEKEGREEMRLQIENNLNARLQE